MAAKERKSDDGRRAEARAFAEKAYALLQLLWREPGWPPEIVPVRGLQAEPFGVAFWWAVWHTHYSRLDYDFVTPVNTHREQLLDARAQTKVDAGLRLSAGAPLNDVLDRVFDAGRWYRPPKNRSGPSRDKGKLRDAQRACMVRFLVSRAGLTASRGRDVAGPFVTACDAVALAERVSKQGLKMNSGEKSKMVPELMLSLLTYTPGLSATDDIASLAEKEARHVATHAKTPKELSEFHASLGRLQAHLKATAASAVPLEGSANILRIWQDHRPTKTKN